MRAAGAWAALVAGGEVGACQPLRAVACPQAGSAARLRPRLEGMSSRLRLILLALLMLALPLQAQRVLAMGCAMNGPAQGVGGLSGPTGPAGHAGHPGHATAPELHAGHAGDAGPAGSADPTRFVDPAGPSDHTQHAHGEPAADPGACASGDCSGSHRCSACSLCTLGLGLPAALPAWPAAPMPGEAQPEAAPLPSADRVPPGLDRPPRSLSA